MLWFKHIYVADILSGIKTDTIRRASPRLPKAGDQVMFSVGPRPPFARALIVSITAVDGMTRDRQAQVNACLGDTSNHDLVCLEFVAEAV